jgi:benzoyl-CoA reductase subunit C
MILGSENNDMELLSAIESWGANIVIDDHCVGSRYFWGEIVPEEDRLRAMANRYVQRPPCPTKDFPERRRLPHVLRLAKEYNVQAAVILLQKFCEPHQFDTPMIESALNKLNIPTVVVEIDAPISLGQVRIRVESLLDMIRIET